MRRASLGAEASLSRRTGYWRVGDRPMLANILFARFGPPRSLAAPFLGAFPRSRAALARFDPLSALYKEARRKCDGPLWALRGSNPRHPACKAGALTS